MGNRWLQGLAVAAGYVAALLAATACVALRYLWIDPADVDASQGMFAFGDVLSFLVLGGLFSLVPTLFLLRMLRASEPFWRALSWAGPPWAATTPVLGLLYASLSAAGFGSSAPAALLSVFLLLRAIVSPASFAGLGLAWIMCGSWPALRRRLAWSILVEGLSVVAFAAWFATVMTRSG